MSACLTLCHRMYMLVVVYSYKMCLCVFVVQLCMYMYIKCIVYRLECDMFVDI